MRRKQGGYSFDLSSSLPFTEMGKPGKGSQGCHFGTPTFDKTVRCPGETIR